MEQSESKKKITINPKKSKLNSYLTRWLPNKNKEKTKISQKIFIKVQISMYLTSKNHKINKNNK